MAAVEQRKQRWAREREGRFDVGSERSDEMRSGAPLSLPPPVMHPGRDRHHCGPKIGNGGFTRI